MKKVNIFDLLIVGIQCALSIAILVLLRKVLPSKFIAVIGLLLALTALIVIFVLLIKKVAKWTTRISSIMISIILGLLLYVASSGLSTLNTITGSKTETAIYSLVVMSDSTYEYIEDLDEQKVGICSLVNEEQYTKAVANITRNITINEIDFEDVNSMQQALYNGEVEAIILNEAFRATIEEVNENFSEETRIITNHEITTTVTTTERVVDVTKNSYNIFISGIDTYGPVNTISRSDVNMIVTVNPVSKTILMTSIPRDYYVTLASFGALDKLTHAGIYGVNESVQTLENLFGIDIDYYARVNFTSLVTMVDALGGINIYNPEAFSTGHYDFPVGLIDLDGNMALSYSRERYNLAGGDRSRVLNQQRVLQGMLQKAMSTAIITNYSSILSAINGCFETNMTGDEIQSIISMQLGDNAVWHFKSQSVNGTSSSSTECYSYKGAKLYVMIPDESTVTNCTQNIKAIMNG